MILKNIVLSNHVRFHINKPDCSSFNITIANLLLDAFPSIIVPFVFNDAWRSSLLTMGAQPALDLLDTQAQQLAHLWLAHLLPGKLCITSNRLSSFVLLASRLSISCPFQRGHFCFGRTKISVQVDKTVKVDTILSASRSGGIGRRATFRA
jgi:hypothetical protein